MRNLRTAAVSGMTAVALVAGSTTVAVADDHHEDKGLSASVTDKMTSHAWGNRLHADDEVTGTDLFGFERDYAAVPAWAKVWYAVTVLGVVGSVLGMVSLPVVNELKAQGIIK